MDLLRSFISLFNRSGETTLSSNSVDLSIPVCYYGHTYVTQPNSDELKRASFILESRNKNVGKTFTYLLSCYDEGTIVLRDNSRHAVRKFEIRKIVVSCVDAKHQRLLAIFYDNDSSESSMGMECHLFLCRTKMVAKMAANKIGDKLNKLQVKPTEKLPPKIKLDQVNITTRHTVCDFDYENISKFFREEVFNLSVQEPSSESSSTYLTTGCDSGRASTVASVDTRSEEIGRELINPIQEDDELEPEVNMMEETYKLNPRVKELLNESHVINHENNNNNNKNNKSVKKSKDTVTSSSSSRNSSPVVVCDNNNDGDNKKTNVKNRYSEQYDATRGKSNGDNDIKPCKKFSTERYSHQYELTGKTGRPEMNNNKYGNDRECLMQKEDTSNIENQIDNEHETELKETDCNTKEDNRILTEQSTTESASQNIQNRYSVHYDLQDELLFNEDEDDVFVKDETKEKVVGPLDFSDLLSNKDFALRKIDKRELHRLTYLSATDI